MLREGHDIKYDTLVADPILVRNRAKYGLVGTTIEKKYQKGCPLDHVARWLGNQTL